MRLIETPHAPERPPRRERWSAFKDKAIALALAGTAGCAHFEKQPDYPPGPVSVYSVESAEAERVVVGNDYEVLLRPSVAVRDGRGHKALADYEARHGPLPLTYCWFVYQEAGYSQGEQQVLFLLNPRYKEHGQQRYIGALLDFGTAPDGTPLQAVVPVAPERNEPDTPDNVYWSFGKPPERREDALFLVYPGTLVPVMDDQLAGSLADYCAETAVPEHHVVEFGPTSAALAVYPQRVNE